MGGGNPGRIDIPPLVKKEIIMDIHVIVKKLIGPIEPIGETLTDEYRFENLKIMTDLVDKLLSDISHVACNKTRVEYSMKTAGEYASKFFDETGITQ